MLRVLAKLVGVIAAVVAGLLISLALVHAVKFGFIPSVLTFSMFGRLYGYVESYGSTKFFVHDHRIIVGSVNIFIHSCRNLLTEKAPG